MYPLIAFRPSSNPSLLNLNNDCKLNRFPPPLLVNLGVIVFLVIPGLKPSSTVPSIAATLCSCEGVGSFTSIDTSPLTVAGISPFGISIGTRVYS